MNLKSRVPKLMELLLCVFADAATMMLINSMTGMFIGLAVGAVSIFDTRRVVAADTSETLLGSTFSTALKAVTR